MRRGWITTEFWILCLLGAGAWLKLEPVARAQAISILADGYILARMLYKVRRGLFSSSLKSTELCVYIVSQIPVLFVYKTLWILLAVNYCVFALARGRTKGIGVITQFIHR